MPRSEGICIVSSLNKWLNGDSNSYHYDADMNQALESMCLKYFKITFWSTWRYILYQTQASNYACT